MANCDRCIFGKNEDDCFPHVAEDRECSMFRVETNADRIRGMGDIELANFLSGLSMGCVNCPMYYQKENDECVKHCNTAWQEWLKEESDGE